LERSSKKRAREELLRIIDLCESIEAKGGDPFDVNVRREFEKLREYLRMWKKPPELVLDAKTVNKLASLIKLQDRWVKYRSTGLFLDPLLVELKIRSLRSETLANALARAWHPIITLEQLTLGRLKEGLEYWRKLTPLEGRGKGLPSPEGMGEMPFEELLRLGFVSETAFNQMLNELWDELKEKAAGGKIDYWEFIFADSYEETLRRAYLTSFLLTLGYGTLEVDPIKDERFIVPFKKPVQASQKQAVSVPIAMNKEQWEKVKEKIAKK
jgi:hypothetical protein